jgi:hypothetical protein
MTYFNIKTNNGVETIDQISDKDFPSYKDFMTEKKRLLNEYRLCGMSGVYFSFRCTNDWKNK